MEKTIVITDSGSSIKIVNGAEIRNILKNQIIEISVIKTNIIKIDNGQGALQNVFIVFEEVSAPIAANPESLKEMILGFLTPAAVLTGYATEAKQTNEIELLNSIKNYTLVLQTLLTAIDSKLFYTPVLIDESGAKVIYKGFAALGSSQDKPVWAIERIRTEGGIKVSTWADGNKNFDNVWIDRLTLIYN